MSARFDEQPNDARFIPRDWMAPGTTAIAADLARRAHYAETMKMADQAWAKYRQERPFLGRCYDALNVIKAQANNWGWMQPLGQSANASARPPAIQLPPGSSPELLSRASNAVNYSVMNDNTAFFPPGYPLQPQAPPAAKPRRFDYPFWWNLQIPPRAYESFSFRLLRHIADSYDLLRIVIETCKNRIAFLEWDIVPTDEDIKSPSSATQDRMKWFKAFMQTPDLKHDFATWARAMLEDMLVIDAMTLYVDRAFDGGVRAWRQIDGADITVKLDYHGETPEPPETAYQQIIKGLPAIDYMDGVEMFYSPFNRRVHKGYGYSPVEQILITINIALRRQLWQLSFYRDGANTPFMIEAPPNWNREQMDDFSTWFNNLFFDNPSQRWRSVIVPNGSKAVETNHDALKDEQDDWLASLICYAFGCDRSQLTKPMNRASAEHSGEQSSKENFIPFTLFFQSEINRWKNRCFGWTDIEFRYGGLETYLTQEKSTALATLTNQCGGYTVNEIRNLLGQDPLPGGDQCLIGAGLQLVQLDAVNKLSDKQEQQEQQQQQSAELHDAQMKGTGKSVPGSIGGGGGKKAGGTTTKPAASSKVKKGFDATASPIGGLQPYGHHPRTRNATMMHPRGVKSFYRSGGARPVTRQAKFKLRQPDDKRVARLKGILQRALKTKAQVVSQRIVKRFRKFTKADEARPSRQVQRAFINQLMSEGWAAYPDEIRAALEAATEDTVTELLGDAGLVPTEEQWDYIDEATTNLARDRAGELVGMKWDEDTESWVDNPDARWAINDDTRDELNGIVTTAEEQEWSSDQLSKAIQDADLFGEARADMIARTEIKRIDAMSADATAKGAGATMKKWLLSSDHDEEDDCDANADADWTDIDDDFPSGADLPPEHPNCQCVVTFGWQEEEGGEPQEEG